MDNTMKKRWISLYVENQVGVLSKISGLFSGKSYNLESLTVGRTEDPTISRMTIETNSDEETYEQIRQSFSRSRRPIRQRYVIMEKTVCFLNLYTRHIKIQRSSSFYVLNSIQLKL